MKVAFEQFVDALSVENFEALCSAVEKRHKERNRKGLPEVTVHEFGIFVGRDMIEEEPIKASRKKAIRLYMKRTGLPMRDAQTAFGCAIAENCTDYGREVLSKTAGYIEREVFEYITR